MRFVENLGAGKALREREGIKLILVGVRFDESRMFDFLDYIRHDARHKKIPIVAAIIIPTDMSPETISGLAHTTKIFGASVFVNLNDFTDDNFDNTRIRLMIEALLLPPDGVPANAEQLN